MESTELGANLARLVCGSAVDQDCELSRVLDHLQSSVSAFSGRCFSFLGDVQSGDLLIYGPFCARTLLETSCAALLARLDPFRLISIKRFQEHPNFDVSRRHKLSIQWRGDIIPSEKPPVNRWSNDAVANQSARALLSDYFGDVYWAPALTRIADEDIAEIGILTDTLSIEPENAVSYLRQEADRLFSSLSKGIHPEFVIPIESAYDKATIQDLMQRTIILVARMAAISHWMPMAMHSLERGDATQAINTISSGMTML